MTISGLSTYLVTSCDTKFAWSRRKYASGRVSCQTWSWVDLHILCRKLQIHRPLYRNRTRNVESYWNSSHCIVLRRRPLYRDSIIKIDGSERKTRNNSCLSIRAESDTCVRRTCSWAKLHSGSSRSICESCDFDSIIKRLRWSCKVRYLNPDIVFSGSRSVVK